MKIKKYYKQRIYKKYDIFLYKGKPLWSIYDPLCIEDMWEMLRDLEYLHKDTFKRYGCKWDDKSLSTAFSHLEVRVKEGKYLMPDWVLQDLETKLRKGVNIRNGLDAFMLTKMRMYWFYELLLLRIAVSGSSKTHEHLYDAASMGFHREGFRSSDFEESDLAMPIELEHFLKSKTDYDLLIFWLRIIKLKYMIDSFFGWISENLLGSRYDRYDYDPSPGWLVAWVGVWGRVHLKVLINLLKEMRKEARGPSMTLGNYYDELVAVKNQYRYGFYTDYIIGICQGMFWKISEWVFEALLPGESFEEWVRSGKQKIKILSYWKAIWKGN